MKYLKILSQLDFIWWYIEYKENRWSSFSLCIWNSISSVPLKPRCPFCLYMVFTITPTQTTRVTPPNCYIRWGHMNTFTRPSWREETNLTSKLIFSTCLAWFAGEALIHLTCFTGGVQSQGFPGKRWSHSIMILAWG